MEKNHHGRWTQAEHEMFLQGLQLYGKNWKKIEQMIGSRTGCQIRSHAQKFFLKGKERTEENYDQSSNHEGSSMVRDAKVLQDLSADHKHHFHEERDTQISFLQKHLNKYVMQPQANTGIERKLFDFWNNCIEAPVKISIRKNSTDSCFSDTGEHQQAENGCPQLLRTHSFIPFENNCLSGLEKIQNLRTLH